MSLMVNINTLTPLPPSPHGEGEEEINF